MANSTVVAAEERGLHRLVLGAGTGLFGGILGVIVPIVFLFLSSEAPGGFFVFGRTLIEAISVLVMAGAILFLLSLFLYRRAFASLRRADRWFVLASALCLLGTVGFLLLLIAAIALLGSSDSLVNCLQGRPTQALSCLRSASPLGGATALLGFWMGWLGGLGIVLGLGFGGRFFHRDGLGAGAALYAILLLLVVGPFVALLYAFPGSQYLLFLIPLLIVLAPGFVFVGARGAPIPAR